MQAIFPSSPQSNTKSTFRRSIGRSSLHHHHTNTRSPRMRPQKRRPKPPDKGNTKPASLRPEEIKNDFREEMVLHEGATRVDHPRFRGMGVNMTLKNAMQ